MSERKPFETFKHYRIGKGRVTLSVDVNDGHVRVGLACCFPKDQFDRSEGRMIATARRLDKADKAFHFEFERNEQLLWEQLRSEFISHATHADKFPKWVRYSLVRKIRQDDLGFGYNPF